MEEIWKDLVGYEGSDEEEIANLALIAEAPNLLAELTRLRSELQQKDEIIKELIVVAARISMQLKKGDSYRVHIESLIKKANVF